MTITTSILPVSMTVLIKIFSQRQTKRNFWAFKSLRASDGMELKGNERNHVPVAHSRAIWNWSSWEGARGWTLWIHLPVAAELALRNRFCRLSRDAFSWHPLKIALTKTFSRYQSFQLLLILTAVQLIGAVASFTDISELWAVYSVTQGLQVGYGLTMTLID